MGISAIRTHIPENRLDAREIGARSGVPMEELSRKEFDRKAVLAADRSINDMALLAARDLLSAERIEGDQLEAIVYASTGLHDHRFWSPSAKLQAELGLKDTYCFELNNGCNAGNAALGVVSRLLDDPRSRRYALIVVCDALSRVVDHHDAGHAAVFNFADAASAILVDKELGAREILSHFSLTDGRLSDYMMLGEAGRLAYQPGRDTNALKHAYQQNYPRVIRTAVRKAGREVSEVERVFISQGDPQLFGRIAAASGIELHRFARTSRELGHLGGTDIFYGLQRALDDRSLRSGDLVVLASSSIGFSWGATLLRI